ncbi:MAG: SDR family oxidoreductase [Schleiferiaceae bacterium]|nr:SDR family oxidoreductase [Schleiferiaceae bacterium]
MSSKSILVIGGSKGIGAEIVKQLRDAGHIVYTASRSGEANNYHQIYDASSKDASLQLPEALDGVVYCPGTINLKPFHRISVDAFEEEMQINFFGAVRVLQQTFPVLKKGQHPSVVLFSTVAVSQGMPFHAGIASAKGALEGLIRSLASEWSPTIRVNGIAPSLTNTSLAEKLLNNDQKKKASDERHPLKRIGEATDLASAATFLLGEQSSWITGQILHVDGGMSSIRPI